MASYLMIEVGGPVMALSGSVGEGVLGPLEEAAEVKDDCDPLYEAIELRRGEEVPEE